MEKGGHILNELVFSYCLSLELTNAWLAC